MHYLIKPGYIVITDRLTSTASIKEASPQAAVNTQNCKLVDGHEEVQNQSICTFLETKF